MQKKYKILIADELPVIALGLKELLSRHLPQDSIEGVSMFNDVIEKTKDNYDILITDIIFNKTIILNELQNIRTKYSDIKILILTQHIDYELIDILNKIGIEGFVLKNEKIEQLIWTVKAIILGNTQISEQLNNSLSTEIDKKEKFKNVQGIKLTTRECEILCLIAKEYTTNDISKTLFISTHTVESHRKSLIAKFDSKNVAGLIKKACQYGLIDYFGTQLFVLVQIAEIIY